MPIYEYTCKKCGAEFEALILRAADEKENACPECDEKDVERHRISRTAAKRRSGGGSDTGYCGPVG